jgi:FixJ family two-component response regulator
LKKFFDSRIAERNVREGMNRAWGSQFWKIVESVMSLARVLSHDPVLSDKSHVTPIVVVVQADLSVRESLESLIGSEGWQPEAFVPAKKPSACLRAQVPNSAVPGSSSPGLSGPQLQKKIGREPSGMPIIFVTGRRAGPTTVQGIKAGTAKPFNIDVLVSTIGESLESIGTALARGTEIRELQSRYASLTHRERQVMAFVVFGFLNKQASLELGISEITVKAHRGHVMKKMKAESFADLVRMAVSLRLERPGPPQSLLQAAV